ncbi:hypothetical protein ACFY2M_46060, partial [Streptomyces sp. NPDC001276]|uniref:hypothetical protein n=1 Tax=Streptomyces sp. NPDC001276 TaxID=3364555 RepID=UPI0036BA8112
MNRVSMRFSQELPVGVQADFGVATHEPPEPSGSTSLRRWQWLRRALPMQATFAEQVDGLIQNQRSAVVETRSTATPPPPS